MKTLSSVRMLVVVCLSSHAWAARSLAQAPSLPVTEALATVKQASQHTRDGVDEERARRLFAEAKQRYAQGDYEGALARLKESYEWAPLPGLLFDVAQTLRRMGRCSEANTTLATFLATERRPALVMRAEQMKRELASCDDSSNAASDGSTAPAAAPLREPTLLAPRRAAWSRPAALATFGLGLGFATAAFALALRGRALADEVSSAQHWNAELAHKDRQGVRSNRAAWSCGSVALTLLGSSLTLRLLGGDAAPVASRVALAWSGRF